ncbi:Sec-independent protein translocase protein TatB [Hahella sp. SMD15-11]|uniref:Sec-independent protein translocase protein TatB n=1 Tax=Thermohahella caldifontis TaxID=3142973 RepID=A0AB39UWP4_9GAMM
MFDIGFTELLLVALVGLLVLGPERLPGAVRTVGLWVGRIRRMVSSFSEELDRQIKADELRKKLKEEGDTLGLEKIQSTVDEALQEAKQYEHLTEPSTTTKREHD